MAGCTPSSGAGLLKKHQFLAEDRKQSASQLFYGSREDFILSHGAPKFFFSIMTLKIIQNQNQYYNKYDIKKIGDENS